MNRDQGGIPRWLTAVNLLAILVALAVVIPTQVRASHTPAPEGLCVCARLSDTAPKLTWRDPSSLTQGYVLQRSRTLDFSSGVVEIRIARNTFDFVDETLTFSQIFRYRIASIVGTDRSAWSNDVGAGNPAGTAPAKPAAPDNINVAQNPNGLRITWTNPATNETGVWVQRSGDSGTTWEFRASLSLNSTSYLDTDPPPGTVSYRIWNFNSGGLAPSYAVQYVDPRVATPSVPNVQSLVPTNLTSATSLATLVPTNLTSATSLVTLVPTNLTTATAIASATGIVTTLATATSIVTAIPNPVTMIPTINPSTLIPDPEKLGAWIGIKEGFSGTYIQSIWLHPSRCRLAGATCAPPAAANCFGVFLLLCYYSDLDPSS